MARVTFHNQTWPARSRGVAAGSGVASMALALLLAICALASTRTVAAQESDTPNTRQPGALMDASPQLRPQMLSFFAGLQYGHFGAYGLPLMIGGRYYIPLVHDGFIPPVNDEFGLEFGLDFNITFLSSVYSDSTVFGFGVPVDVLWDFHFTPHFDAYAKLGIVLGSAFSDRLYGGFWWTIRSAIGLRLKLTEALYFRAEAGYPAIMAGLGFAF
jgi:hypothetical protein